MRKRRQYIAYFPLKTPGNKARRHRHSAWLLKQRAKKLLKRRRVRRGGITQNTALAGIHRNTHTRQSVRTDENRKITIDLPESLDLTDNYEETVSHFTVLREAITTGKRIKNLDFSKIVKITPSAALVLASLVDQWNQLVGGRLRAAVSTWQPEVKRLLCQMGYFELLQIERPEGKWPEHHLTYLQFKRGRVGDANAANLARELRIEIENLTQRRIKRHFLFEGLSEAITNVVQHAYKDVTDDRRKQWWLSASFDSETNLLTVTFLDHGAGIPVTLPSSDLFEFFKDVFYTWTDSEKIEAAMQIGRTSSELEERGKGLHNLVYFAKAHNAGRLAVYSLRGLFIRNFERVDDQLNMDRHRDNFDNSIGGTLIEWSVTLNEPQ